MDPSCSARLISPFLKFAATLPSGPEFLPECFRSADLDARVPLALATAMLDRGVERLKDDSLGLRMGAQLRFGNGGTFDYVVRSSPNIATAVSVAAKYARLLSDDFHLTYERWRSAAVIRVHGRWSRATADFAMSGLFSVHLAELATVASVEAWFPIPAPRDTSVYEAHLPRAALRFGAPFYAFSVPEPLATLPMPAGGDPEVHQLLLARADRLLEELTQQTSLSAAVHRIVLRDLRTGGPTPEEVARALHMSPRTLSRRLACQGTTFNALVDGARKQRSRELLRDPKIPLTEVAFLLGFSHVESFYRAFKRWTGTTPLVHRNALLSA